MGLLDRVMGRNKGDGDVRTEDLIVLYATVAGGVNEEDGFRLRDLFNSASAIDWHFLNPGSFQAFFSANESGRAQASALINELTKLKNLIGTLAELKTGTAEGPLIVSRRTGGGFDSVPIGEAVNRAIRVAHDQK